MERIGRVPVWGPLNKERFTHLTPISLSKAYKKIHCYTAASSPLSIVGLGRLLGCAFNRPNTPREPPSLSTLKHTTASSPSLFHFIVNGIETLQSQAARYVIPEQLPFYPENLPPSLLPPPAEPPVLHPAAASININDKILNIYLKQFLPLLAVPGDDGNYSATASSDLDCLQAISGRIHYGYYVAEVKFRDAPEDYEPAIRDQDREGLMKLLTYTDVEEQVRKRVEKKAAIFGQQVSLESDTNGVEQNGKYKIDPSLASRLYGEWVMPLTKLVQVEYLLRRLD